MGWAWDTRGTFNYRVVVVPIEATGVTSAGATPTTMSFTTLPLSIRSILTGSAILSATILADSESAADTFTEGVVTG